MSWRGWGRDGDATEPQPQPSDNPSRSRSASAPPTPASGGRPSAQGSTWNDGAGSGSTWNDERDEPRETAALDKSASQGGAAAQELLEEYEDVHAREAVVLCVANQKGGVGKTTTAVSLGAALADEGIQVLIVDLDPQGNATTGLGLRAQEGAPSTYRVLVERMDVEDAAEPTAVKGLHVLPSSLDLAGAEIELVPAFSRENRLKEALDAVRDLYDVVLIDCPPSLGLLTINALVAADKVLVPIQCEYYALEGLGQLMRTIKLVTDGLNDDLELGGVVLTMFDARTNLSQQVVDEVRDYFGDDAYHTIVPRTVRLSEAPSFGQPITVFDSTSRGARAYQRLAREVAARLGLPLVEEEVSPLDRLLGGPPPEHEPAGDAVEERSFRDSEASDGRESTRLPTDLDLSTTQSEPTPRSATDDAGSAVQEAGPVDEPVDSGSDPSPSSAEPAAEHDMTRTSDPRSAEDDSAHGGTSQDPLARTDEPAPARSPDSHDDRPEVEEQPVVGGIAGRAWWDQ